MSREQWGHGYRQGVRDAEIGHVRKSADLKKFAEDALVMMWKWNQKKINDRSLFPVNAFKSYLALFGDNMNEKGLWKDIYDYILYNEPFGCYVSGPSNKSIDEDFFVVCN